MVLALLHLPSQLHKFQNHHNLMKHYTLRSFAARPKKQLPFFPQKGSEAKEKVSFTRFFLAFSKGMWSRPRHLPALWPTNSFLRLLERVPHAEPSWRDPPPGRSVRVRTVPYAIRLASKKICDLQVIFGDSGASEAPSLVGFLIFPSSL